jgi:curved DNA-binding protein
MEYKDYYQIMGVARDATQDEIRRAYRKLARKYHPDVSKEPDAEERFKAIGEANEVLRPARQTVEGRAGFSATTGLGRRFRVSRRWLHRWRRRCVQRFF